jgi:hypothetical protein
MIVGPCGDAHTAAVGLRLYELCWGVLARRRTLDAQIQNFDACCDPGRGPADLPNRAVTLGPNIGPKLPSTGCHREIPDHVRRWRNPRKY